MRKVIFTALCLFTISSYSVLSGAQLGNSGGDWVNFDGTFMTPVTSAQISKQNVGNMGGPFEVDMGVQAFSTGEVIDVQSNGGPEAKQLNGIVLNSMFYKPNTAISGSTVDYNIGLALTNPLKAGDTFYLYSIAKNNSGASTTVKVEAASGGSLVTSFSWSELDMELGSIFSAPNALGSEAGFTTVVTNAGANGTNTRPLALTFGVDVDFFNIVITAVDVNGAGNYDGFNFGMAVPEPSTYLLMGSSLIGILFLASRRKKMINQK